MKEFKVVFLNTDEGKAEAEILKQKLTEYGYEGDVQAAETEIDEAEIHDYYHNALLITPIDLFITTTIKNVDEVLRKLEKKNGEWFYEGENVRKLIDAAEEFDRQLYGETMYDQDDYDYGDEDQNSIMWEIDHYIEDDDRPVKHTSLPKEVTHGPIPKNEEESDELPF